MTNVKIFEEKVKNFISSLKENFDSIDVGIKDEISDNTLNDVTSDVSFEEPNLEELSTSTLNSIVPIEKAPKFRIYWRAWKEGNSTSGQTESNLETAQMARAEAMTKLYDLGFNDIEILAIETIQNSQNEI